MSKGEKAAQEEFYIHYYKLVFGISMSILKNKEDSLDVTQNVLVKLYTLSADKFPKTSPLSWLYSVTKNEALHFIRSENKTVSLDEELLNIYTVANEIEKIVDMDTYYSMIGSLSPVEREIVTLKVISGLRYREIARLLDMPTGTVQWKYHTAVHKLRIALTNLVIDMVTIWGGYNYWRSTKTGGGELNGGVDVSAVPEFFTTQIVILIVFAIVAVFFIAVAAYYIIKFFKERQQNNM